MIWLDIEMAPRDGTVVLACCVPEDLRQWTNHNLWAAPKAASWRAHQSAKGVAPPTWRDSRGSACRPTHFTALPDPPEVPGLELAHGLQPITSGGLAARRVDGALRGLA